MADKDKDQAQDASGMTTIASIKGESPSQGGVKLDDPKAKADFNAPEQKEAKPSKKEAKEASPEDLKSENAALEKEVEKLRAAKEEREKNEKLKAEKAELEKEEGKANKKTIFIKSNGANVTVEKGRKVIKGSVNGEEFSVPVDQSVEVDAHIAEALQPMIDQQNANKTTAAI